MDTYPGARRRRLPPDQRHEVVGTERTLFQKMTDAREMLPDPSVRRVMLPEYPWLDQTQSIGADVFDGGWHILIQDLLDRLDEILGGTDARLTAIQMKEAHGRLRFYYELHGASEAQRIAVFERYDAAWKRSATTCIDCGGPGRMRRDRSWIVSLCDKHA